MFFLIFGFLLTFSIEGTILCLETSTYKDVFFAGGGTHYNMKKGYAKIFAISFNEKLETINSLVLQGSTQRTSMGVTSIKRVKNTNICLLGANSTLFVVNFDGCKFEIINKIEEIHSCKLQPNNPIFPYYSYPF